jgi:glycosyltransferase involved in cell wall biosynthesis
VSSLPVPVAEEQPAASATRLRVLACTAGRHYPGPRFRVQQYHAILARHGVDLVEAPTLIGDYPPRFRLLRPLWGAGVLAERMVHAVRSWHFDVTLLQREMVTTLLTLERFTHRPRVLDVDDAIWLPAGRNFVRRIAQLVDRVVCGNNFLGNVFSQWHRNVVVIPTAVPTDRFVPDRRRRQERLIGWSGSTSNLPYLYDIEPALLEVFRRHPDVRLRVLSNTPPRFRHLPPARIEFLRWSPKTEVRGIQECAIGLMPLRDTEWERGKCSLKMLQYAACGVASIVSPVGMNAELLAMAPIGVAAGTIPEWIDALESLLAADGRAVRFGEAGRRLVVDRFDAEHWGARLGDELRAAAGA